MPRKTNTAFQYACVGHTNYTVGYVTVYYSLMKVFNVWLYQMLYLHQELWAGTNTALLRCVKQLLLNSIDIRNLFKPNCSDILLIMNYKTHLHIRDITNSAYICNPMQ